MFYTVVQQGFKEVVTGEKWYFYFTDISFTFPTVKKKFQNRLTTDEVIAKRLAPRFFETKCVYMLAW